MLFKINESLKDAEGREFFDLNPGAEAIPEFNSRSSRQMFFVCLVADRAPDSPLRTLPEPQRRLKAAELVGFPTEDGKRLDKNGRNVVNGKVPTVETAIAKYRELQYDPDKAELDAIDAQIQEAITMMTADKMSLCSREIVKSNDKTKETTKTTYVDAEAAFKLAETAMKLGARLVELKKAKNDLMALIPKSEPIMADIITYSAHDLDPEEMSSDGAVSTIDAFMAKKREQTS